MKMANAGQRLRLQREQKQISLSEISDSTKISTRMLEAIESEDLQRLPGGVFNRNFVRLYANYIGLDAQEILNQFLEETVGPVLAESAGSRARRPTMPWLLTLLIALILGVSGVAAYRIYWQRRQLPLARSVGRSASGKPARGIADSAIARQASHATPAATDLRSVAMAPAGDSPKPIVPPIPAAQNDAITLTLSAVQDSWVALTVDGSKAWEGTLAAGTERTFQARESFGIVLGNAGGVRAMLNGRPLPAFGALGAVAKFRYPPPVSAEEKRD
jgi:cytoskeletal protein RodZ